MRHTLTKIVEMMRGPHPPSVRINQGRTKNTPAAVETGLGATGDHHAAGFEGQLGANRTNPNTAAMRETGPGAAGNQHAAVSEGQFRANQPSANPAATGETGLGAVRGQFTAGSGD